MELKVIGTGSKGNAYLLENEEEALLIECGVNIKAIKQAVNFSLNKINACIVTHEHGDHAKSIKEIMNLGIKVYTGKKTFEALRIDPNHHRAYSLWQNDDFKVGGFKVKSFDVEHDAAEPVGFLINHKETGNILFLTDTVYSPYTFRGLNNIIIEANYCPEIAKKKLSEKEFLRNRILQSHMSIDTCIDFLKANDITSVNNIVLIHLSDSNSHEKEFQYRVEKATGKNVTVAYNGLVMNLNKTPF